MLGLGLALEHPASSGGVKNPYAGYAAYFDFVNQRYAYNGAQVASLSAMPGYVYTDSDNTPNISASGYLDDVTTTAFRITSPVTTEQDFIFWAVVNFSAVTDGGNQWPASISDGTINEVFSLLRDSTGLGMFYSEGTATSSGVVLGAGRAVILGRRRSGKNTAAVKTSGSVVTVGTESGAIAFPTGLTRIGIASYDGAGSGWPDTHYIQGVYLRTGTFSDAALTTILGAA